MQTAFEPSPGRPPVPRPDSEIPGAADLEAALGAFPLPAAAIDDQARPLAWSSSFAELLDPEQVTRNLAVIRDLIDEVARDGRSRVATAVEFPLAHQMGPRDVHILPGPATSPVLFLLIAPVTPDGDRAPRTRQPSKSPAPPPLAVDKQDVLTPRLRPDTLAWQAVDAAGVGVVLVRRNSATSLCTQEVLRLMGWSRPDISISEWIEDSSLIDPSARSLRQAQHPILRAMRGESFQHQILARAVEGAQERQFISFSGRCMKDDPRFRAALVLTDVTHHLKERLDLEELLDVLAHDLQEPARIVRSYVEIIGEQCRAELQEAPKRYMGYVTESADRLQAQLRDFLTFCRVTKDQLALTSVDLGAITATALKTLAPQIEATQALVQSERLPLVRGDEKQLQQLLVGLLDNAIKFRRPDHPPRITIRHTTADGVHRVEVEDNGIGLAEDRAPVVFGMFGRLHPKSAFTGTGSGLAICRKIVQRHGGRIGYRSRNGAGTVFWFELPC